MYSRAEVSQMRHEFWTSFGQYLAPQPNIEGARINWVNYKTGEKHIQFKMHADTKEARIAIELTHPDAGVRHLHFEQLEQFRTMLEQQLQENWSWQAQATGDWDRPVSAVSKTLAAVNIMKREDWPALISFFKPRLIALDAFWNDVKFAFELLR